MRRIPLPAALAAAVVLALPLAAQERSAPPARSADSMIFVMGTGSYTPPDLPLPEKNARFIDPNFHTTLYRMTDRMADGYSGPGIQNEYAKADPENADGSLVILRGNDGEWYLYDRASSAPVSALTVFHEGNQEPEPRWDPQDPNRFFFLRNLSLCAYDIARDSAWTVHDFSTEFPGAFLITTGTEGDASLDRRRWAFMVVDSLFTTMSLAVYDRTADAVIGRKDGGFPDAINWVGMSMSGAYCVVGYDSLLSPEVFTADLGRSWMLTEGSNGHGDLALDASGRDVLVYQNVRTDFIAMSDLETGAETPLVE
ncbi:MAG: hypothetical protein QHI48_10435, partial [Bacteroidota bacterium]|nr:hypothetical protein [Bacteroidota bacterium]